VIEPPYDDDDAPLPEGEVVALPVPTGRAWQLSFPSPFETYLLLDGRRVRVDEGPDTRALLVWVSRRIPALWRALEERRVVLGTFVDGEVHALDVCEPGDPNDEGSITRFLDHGAVRATLEPAGTKTAAFSLLGSLGTRADIERRARATYAPGTRIEVRVEDAGRVVSRREMRVGR
jgi:hypothetical protein